MARYWKWHGVAYGGVFWSLVESETDEFGDGLGGPDWTETWLVWIARWRLIKKMNERKRWRSNMMMTMSLLVALLGGMKKRVWGEYSLMTCEAKWCDAMQCDVSGITEASWGEARDQGSPKEGGWCSGLDLDWSFFHLWTAERIVGWTDEWDI